MEGGGWRQQNTIAIIGVAKLRDKDEKGGK